MLSGSQSAPAKAGPHSWDLRIRRRCPSCGGPIRHTDADRVIGCEFCGVRLAIASGGTPRYALPARVCGDDCIVAAKRALRTRSVRVRELQASSILYAPFYRLRAPTWQCWRGRNVPPERRVLRDVRDAMRPGPPSWARPAIEEQLREEPGPFEYRIGVWDFTQDALPSLDLGDRQLGFRTQVFEMLPLGDLLAEASARDGSPAGSDGLASGTPGRIEVELPESAALASLLRQLVAGHSFPETEVLGQALYAPFPQLQLLYYPYALVPFRGQGEQEALVLDAITGGFKALLDTKAWARLQSGLEVRPGDTEGWSSLSRDAELTPLICPECSSPLPWAGAAHVHRCDTCQRFWQAKEGRLSPLPSISLTPPGRALPLEGRVDLPFYRVPGAGGRSVYTPGFQGRHPRPIWNFTLALNRCQPVYDASGEPPRKPGACIEFDPGEARTLRPFLDLCLRGPTAVTWPQARPATKGAELPELVWIPFHRRGADLIEAVTQLGLPVSALPAWTEAEVRGA